MKATVNATKGQIEDFLGSLLWKDIVAELKLWKRGFNEEMLSIVATSKDDNPSTATVLMHIGDIHGRQAAVDYMLQIPHVFLQILNEKKTDDDSQ